MKQRNRMAAAMYAVFMFFSFCTLFAQENLLENGSFETANAGSLEHWQTHTWQQLDDSISVELVPGGKEGSYSVSIENFVPEDTKLIQTVNVSPKTLYRLSGWIRVEKTITGAKGANFSVLDITDISEDVKEASSSWVYRELYGKTGRKQKKLSVTVRLGGYGALAEGKAVFDDIRLEKVKRAPAGVGTVSFAAPKAKPQKKTTASGSAIPGLFFYSLLYLLLLYVLFRKPDENLFNGKYNKHVLLVLGIAAIVLRYVVGAVIEGHTTDIICFKAWSTEVFQSGIPSFYSTESFKDYPPLYMYVLYLVGALRALFGLSFDSIPYLLLVKTPAILADIAAALLLFRLTKNKWAPLIFTAYLFNPAVIINSAAYGQVDSVFALLILLMCTAFYRKQYVKSAAFLGAALALKPQAFLFAPIGLFFILLYILQQAAKHVPLVRRSALFVLNSFSKTFPEDNPVQKEIRGKTVLLALASAAGVYVAANIPFFILHPDEYFALYSRIFASYPYASVNAFNLFSLLGGNWKSTTATFLFLPVNVWSTISAVLITVYSMYVFFRKKEPIQPFSAALVLSVLSFTFMAHIHERYLFPALVLAAAAFLLTERKQYVYLFAALSVLLFINQGVVLFEAMKKVYQIPADSMLLRIGSLLMCAAAVWTIITVSGKNLFPEKIIQLPVNLKPEFDLLQHNEQLRFSRIDVSFIAGAVLLFGLISFWNLGSMNTPDTYWQPAKKKAAAEAVLDASSDISMIAYYSGLGTGSYQVFVSSDGKEFQHIVDIENTNPFGEFTWHTISVETRGQYIRIENNKPGFALYEVIFLNNDSVLPIKYAAITNTDRNPNKQNAPGHLFDEQGTFPKRISYKTGMYFDEIYYPRSAVQYLQGKRPQETTHPELGKLLMAGIIKAFGLHPFVWRIPGVLAGIFMLPALYLLSRRLFQRREAALLVMLLFGFDFMRFTQTRIATIDSFSVFFILLMYLFMAKYFVTKFDGFNRKSLMRLAWPVMLSGIAFGFGAAAKWTSLYSGLGLCVLFFWKLYLISKDLPETGKKIKLFAIACGWGILTFILMPALIYCFSFYPLMKIYGREDLLAFVIKRQVDMYNYHSQLQATHPYSSPWWQWPLIVRPIWYYSGQPHLEGGLIGNIVNMGTPVIWWLGIPAIAYMMYSAVAAKSRTALFILIAFASQYVPWIGSPRKLIFLYHFFTAVPFLLMAVVWSADRLTDGHLRARRITGISLIAAAVILFILFYPVLSGMMVSKAYVSNVLRWFDSWVFFN